MYFAHLTAGGWALLAVVGRDPEQPEYELTGELIAGIITALRGAEPDIDVVVAQPEQILHSMKGGPLLATAHLPRGAAALGDGLHEDAFRHLWPVFDATHPVVHRFMRWTALLDLVESGIRCGQRDKLVAIIVDLKVIATRSEASFCKRILAQRALARQTPANLAQIIDWLETTARAWNADPTPFE
ncbi:MAG: hypothetical protein ACR2IK_03930 [Chloroflexota bacterium]